MEFEIEETMEICSWEREQRRTPDARQTALLIPESEECPKTPD